MRSEKQDVKENAVEQPTGRAQVVVIGLGYIGLPTAAVLAQAGLDVLGVDVNTRTVDLVNAGRPPFSEEGLDAVVAGLVAQGRLRAATAPEGADAFIIAVPTPFTEDRKPDLSYIEQAGRAVAEVLTGGELVVLESTSPPGTTEHLAAVVHSARPDLEGSLCFAHAPERVLPGRIMVEIVENDRIIGGVDEESTRRAVELYSTFTRGEVLATTARTAELAKLTENSFRDVNIAFANELSIIAERQGVDVWELIELANHHPRVNILSPGPGVGGHCIAVDPWFIVAAEPEASRLIATAREVNDSKPEHVIERILARADRFRAPVIAALGITFKADVEDLRESPSRQIVAELARRLPTARILVADPHVQELPAELAEAENVELSELTGALEQADVVALLVDHRGFRDVDATALQEKAVIDTRGIWRRD